MNGASIRPSRSHRMMFQGRSRRLPDVVGDVFVGELLAGIARVIAQPQRRLGHVEPQQPTPHLVTHLRDEEQELLMSASSCG